MPNWSADSQQNIPMPRVNPTILRWARETAGFDLQTAATKIDLHDARGISAADRLAMLEAGEAEPSRAQIVRMAKQYRQPLLVFYLANPPRHGNRGQDFRTLPADYTGSDQAILDALLRDVLARQGLIKAAIEEEDEPSPIPFIGSASISSGVDALVARFHALLGDALARYRRASDVEEAFAVLRSRVESTGVFVILISNLGSHHTNLDVDRFRGFAVADPIAPFIVINDQDSRAAWSFTLLHELAHLWLGQTGVSGTRSEREVERFCNDVASKYLLPDTELGEIEFGRGTTADSLQELIAEFARAKRVSRSMVAYRLRRTGRITNSQWEELSRHFHAQWLEQRQRRRTTSRESDSGPNYYVVRRHRVGDRLLITTQRLLSSGIITTTKAGQVLGVKPSNVQTLFQRPRRTSGSR